uniref:Uncharacterized protein n=1 Tax=Chromera velia CCMP2878 TaxID=1169474 RepID=A0A0G4F3Q3_9ALVE|eukprot:Cvel_2714.t1-p1 / transcript=Cvel_2714.t1 / gene=Cvel_2714 / organism=Chromera_velia_CCMP2878 / gene_product=hypothetical protein / transcript_product=hypothetical protein / location=Cvel_scaffold109:22736-24191(+) / protein_length=316 / sequence_SO=supercontig / SO=protein_coding / is_pseudo=false
MPTGASPSASPSSPQLQETNPTSPSVLSPPLAKMFAPLAAPAIVGFEEESSKPRKKEKKAKDKTKERDKDKKEKEKDPEKSKEKKERKKKEKKEREKEKSEKGDKESRKHKEKHKDKEKSPKKKGTSHHLVAGQPHPTLPSSFTEASNTPTIPVSSFLPLGDPMSPPSKPSGGLMAQPGSIMSPQTKGTTTTPQSATMPSGSPTPAAVGFSSGFPSIASPVRAQPFAGWQMLVPPGAPPPPPGSQGVMEAGGLPSSSGFVPVPFMSANFGAGGDSGRAHEQGAAGDGGKPGHKSQSSQRNFTHVRDSSFRVDPGQH